MKRFLKKGLCQNDDAGKTLTITANNQNDKNVFVQSISINGKLSEGTLLSHQNIMNGDEIIFEMRANPKN